MNAAPHFRDPAVSATFLAGDAGRSSPPAPPGDAAVVVENVTKRFGETVALCACSLTLRRGQVHAIVGENGSGKSTLAKILSGVMAPDEGAVSILGRRPGSPREARRAGLATIFQEILVADEASVLDNLFAGSERRLAAGGASDAAREAVGELQRLSASTVRGGQKVGALPLAVKQWIVILRALLTKPKVLILDESSAALDLDAAHRLHEEIRKLQADGATIIIVTHRIAELVRIADTATVLRDGCVVGVLERGEITEASLIAIMSSEARVGSITRSRTVSNAPDGAPVLLRGEGLRIDEAAPAFDFSLRAGEIVGVTGLDGQGHDNFVRALAGVAGLAAGRISAQADGRGAAIVDPLSAEQAGVSYVSGDRKREGIFPNLSIFENMTIGLYRNARRLGGVLDMSSFRPVFDREAARFSLKFGAARNPITSLSGGNQQKVLLSRALAKAPRILILNDPTRGVDIGTKRDIYRELERYKAGGGAVVYLSSEIEEFLDFADRVDVFFKRTRLRAIPRAQLSEHALLASIFGHPITDTIDFDE